MVRRLALLVLLTVPLAARTLTPYVVKNINADPVAKNVSLYAGPGVLRGDEYFFKTIGPFYDIWRSDGTSTGTYRLLDGHDEPSPVDPQYIGLLDFSIPFQFAGSQFYKAREGQFWISDGTTPGTRPFIELDHDFTPAATLYGAAECPGSLLCYSTGGNTLRVTNGTAAGTHALITTTHGDEIGLPRKMASADGGPLFFGAFDLAHGICAGGDPLFNPQCGELWISDGTTAGTHLIKDIIPGPFPVAPDSLFVTGGKCYFLGYAPELSIGLKALYVSDGTAAGTFRLSNTLYTGTDVAPAFEKIGDWIYLGESNVGIGVVRTDGTVAGTRRVADVYAIGDKRVAGITGSSDYLVFTTQEGAKTDLWSASGAQATKIASFDNAALLGYSPSNKLVYFTETQFHGDAILWSTDGTIAGTNAIKTIPHAAYLIDFRASAHNTFFSAAINSDLELWSTDGTTAGTHPVAPRIARDGSSEVRELTRVGNKIFFLADTDQTWLFTSNGAPENATALVPCDRCRQLEAVDDRLLFSGPAGDFMISDGTPQGTVLLAQWLGTTAYPMAAPRTVGDKVLFIGAEGATVSVWTHGASGNTRVADLENPPTFIYQTVVSGNRMFMTDRSKLFVTDGTASGTRWIRVKLGLVDALTAAGDHIFFDSSADATGEELWTSDGTDAGTHLVRDVAPGGAGSYPRPMTVWKNLLIFTNINDGSVWRSDGTEAGTFQIYSRTADYAVPDGNRLLIVSHTQDAGAIALSAYATDASSSSSTKLWAKFFFNPPRSLLHTDGGDYLAVDSSVVAASTGEIIPIDHQSAFIDLIGFGDRLIGTMRHPFIGKELWGVMLDGTVPAPAPSVNVAFTRVIETLGRRAAVFTVTCDPSSDGLTTILYNTVDGTAHAGKDYTAGSGTIRFGGDDLTSTLVIPIDPKMSGTFGVVLSTPTNATIRNGLSIAYIPTSVLKRHSASP